MVSFDESISKTTLVVWWWSSAWADVRGRNSCRAEKRRSGEGKRKWGEKKVGGLGLHELRSFFFFFSVCLRGLVVPLEDAFELVALFIVL